MPSTAVQLVNLELERAELQTVLGSQIFARCPTLAHLLSYLCEKTFAGETAQIKEYSIALEVFGRQETFDQDIDSIVRVQVNRLRKRLAEYYASEGAAHELRISIPVGHYVPRFEKTSAAAKLTQDAPEIPPTSPSECARHFQVEAAPTHIPGVCGSHRARHSGGDRPWSAQARKSEAAGLPKARCASAAGRARWSARG